MTLFIYMIVIGIIVAAAILVGKAAFAKHEEKSKFNGGYCYMCKDKRTVLIPEQRNKEGLDKLTLSCPRCRKKVKIEGRQNVVDAFEKLTDIKREQFIKKYDEKRQKGDL